MARVKLKSTTVGTLYCDWSSSQNVATNQSTITLSLVFVTASSYNIGPWTDYNGSYIGTTSLTFDGSIPNFQGTRTIATKKMTVTHNSDGTKTQTIKWKWGVNSSWGGYVNPSGSFSITLPTIARASVPTLSASSVTTGNSVTIYTNRASTSFTHTIKFKFGSYSATIATGVGDSYPYPIQTAMASYIPNATSGTGTFTVETYSGSTLIGSKTVSITLNVPSNVVPSISGASTTEANSYVTIGLFVQYNSKIKVVITASGSYGSTITDYTSTFDGKTYKGSTFTIESLQNSGSRTLSVTVKDSRGRTTNYSKSISVTSYSSPNISALSAFRCNSSGVADDSGTYVKVIYSFSITPLSNKNAHTVKIQYKKSSSKTWIDITTISEYTASNATYLTSSLFDSNSSYNLRLSVVDSYNSVTKQVDINTEPTIIDILNQGKGIAFGKVAEHSNQADFEWDIRVKGHYLVTRDITPPNLPEDVMWYTTYVNHYNPSAYTGDKYWMLIDSLNRVYSGTQLNGSSTVKWARVVISDVSDPVQFETLNGYAGFKTNGYIRMPKAGILPFEPTSPVGIGNIGTPTWPFMNLYVASTTAINGMNFSSTWIGFYGNYENSSVRTNRKAWIGDNGSTNFYLNSNGYIYANSVIGVGSDKYLKKDIKPLDNDKYEKFFNSLKGVSFKYKLGRSGRRHIGFIAQDVLDALKDAEIDPVEFAGYCEEDVMLNGEDDPNDEMRLMNEQNKSKFLSLRYGEFIALNTHMIQKCLKKIDDLQTIIDKQNERIKALENMISIQESE